MFTSSDLGLVFLILLVLVENESSEVKSDFDSDAGLSIFPAHIPFGSFPSRFFPHPSLLTLPC